jgi:hypothetical protein
MTEQTQPLESKREPREHYEPPAIVYRGKLEVYAVSCLKQTPLNCNAPSGTS